MNKQSLHFPSTNEHATAINLISKDLSQQEEVGSGRDLLAASSDQGGVKKSFFLGNNKHNRVENDVFLKFV